MKYIIKIILGIILIIIGKSFVSNVLKPEFLGGGIILLLTIVFEDFITDIILNWKKVSLKIHCFWLSLRKQDIRFSMSYLYRIKIDDKFLLVKSSNFPHYQFVGGKYKRLPNFQTYLQTTFDARDDFKLSTQGLMKDDFAIFIPAKNAFKFLTWFNSGKDREISHWREFYEELIDGKANVLSKVNFPYINYNFIGTVTTPIKRTAGWNCYEILQYDILDFIPTTAQENELKGLLSSGDTDYYKWADVELINNLGHDNRQQKQLYKIGQHTKWALNMKWMKP
jgi:hypothetical protein